MRLRNRAAGGGATLLSGGEAKGGFSLGDREREREEGWPRNRAERLGRDVGTAERGEERKGAGKSARDEQTGFAEGLGENETRYTLGREALARGGQAEGVGRGQRRGCAREPTREVRKRE